MKIILCVQRDLHGCIFLNNVLPKLRGNDLRIWLSDKTRPQENSLPTLSRLAMLERSFPIDQLFPIVDALTHSDHFSAVLRTFDGLAKFYEITCETIDDINSSETLKSMMDFMPDLVISARFSYIFKTDALAIPKFGVLNIHPGELPRFAGLFAPMYTVLAGHDCLTSTLHWIDRGIDTGPILAIHRQKYDKKRSLLDQIPELYCGLIPELISQVEKISLIERPDSGAIQERALRQYRSMPQEDDLLAFEQIGGRFWDASEYTSLLKKFIPLQEISHNSEIDDCLSQISQL